MAFNLSAFAGAGAQLFTDNGDPLVGGLVYVYAAGTTTPVTTWTTNSGTTANTNPIVLDAAGRTPNEIWVTGGVMYKFIVRTSTSVLIGTYDNIPAIDDRTAFNNLITVTGTNALLGTSVPPYTSYLTGMTISFAPVAVNTGAVTIDLDGLGAKSITFDTSALLTSGVFAIGQIVTLQYDGTRFQMLNGVTTNKIANDAVTTAKIANDAVTTAKIINDAVTTLKIANSNVTTAKIADANVTTIKIADANVTPAKLSQPFTSGTAVATTSGTSVDFTSIPSWVKRITVMFNGVSNVSSNPFMVQLGDSGGIENTGYVCSTISMASGGTAATSFTDSFGIRNPSGATSALQGQMTICNISSNTWSCQGVFGNDGVAVITGGSKALSATLDRIRITNAASDTFDAGSVNILYE